METLRYTWGVGAQRRYLAPLQALAINTTVNHPYPKHPPLPISLDCVCYGPLFLKKSTLLTSSASLDAQS